VSANAPVMSAMFARAAQTVASTRQSGLSRRAFASPARRHSSGVRVDALPAADLLDRLQGAATREDRQPGQQHLLRPGQQLERPVDRSPQRLVPCHDTAAASGEPRETVLQPAGQLRRGHRRHPRRRQLDRQRHPIQPPHHRRHRRRVLDRHLKPGPDRGRALGKQPHRLRVRDRGQVGVHPGYPQ